MSREKILSGVGASSGKSKGKVKIIMGPSENSRMEEGDILVTEMTSPPYMPSIMKSKAIITDNGGQLSHAAIVGRELGVPCVVGTRKATKILEDSQEVEVNGNRGEVYG